MGAGTKLNELVGLSDVKEQICTVLDLWRFQSMAARRGANVYLGASNLAFVGPTGTGKTIVARLFAAVCAEAGFARKQTVYEVSRADLVGEYLGQTTQRTVDRFEEALGGVLFIDDAPSLVPRDPSQRDVGYEAIDTLAKLMEQYRNQLIVIAAGDGPGMQQFLGTHPSLRQRFPRVVTFNSYTPTELAFLVDSFARTDGFRLCPDLHPALIEFFVERARWAVTGNAWAARQTFEAMRDKLVRRSVQSPPESMDDLITLQLTDIDPNLGRSGLTMGGGTTDQTQVDKLLSELEALPGLAEAKQTVYRLMDLVRVAKQRKALGLHGDLLVGSMVLVGSPGTGKTMMARLIGQLLAAVGVLTQGHLVEVSRVDLVGRWIGHSTQLTKEAFDRARGGVLFVDEAYALSLGDQALRDRDFGQEVIGTLVKLMEEHRDDTIVMVAGYTKEMERFLDSNPGLRGRFSHVINFPGYRPAELVRIVEIMARDRQYNLVTPAREQLSERYHLLIGDGLGSARHARRVLELLVERQAARLSSHHNPSVDDLVTLTIDDIPQQLPPHVERL